MTWNIVTFERCCCGYLTEYNMISLCDFKTCNDGKSFPNVNMSLSVMCESFTGMNLEVPCMLDGELPVSPL